MIKNNIIVIVFYLQNLKKYSVYILFNINLNSVYNTYNLILPETKTEKYI